MATRARLRSWPRRIHRAHGPPVPKAPATQQIAFADSGSYWRSKAEGDAANALGPGPSVPRGPGEG